MEFTKSDIQLVKNAIAISIEKGRKPRPYLVAFIENDTDFINAHAAMVKKWNESEGPAHATFEEQIQWAVDEFRDTKEIREFEA